MKLIITEKDNAARRIAEILSEGGSEAKRRNGVNVYRWGSTRVMGLSGHVVGVDFPPEYSDWRDVEPAELVEADVVKSATQENIVKTLRQLSRQADEAIIATDYDREGELIGKEAYELIREETDVPVKRVRFSSITDREVRNAFAEPDDIDFDLAAAGEARQIIDLVWGAALTRFLSLSARQLGNDFISVGRVQSPTLKLIVDREREIEAFDPEDYWEIFADLTKDSQSFEAQYFYEGEDGNEAERVWDEDAAESAYEVLAGEDAATVTSVRRRTRTDDPPDPFNTTAFISAASSLGYSAQRAMSIAEELYTAGYMTYPRTDNTVYPDDLEPDELLDEFVGSPTFGQHAEMLLEQEELTPTEGDDETTDHPPIHPTGEIPPKGELGEDEWEVFELVVRRFFATVAESAEWAHLRVVAEAANHSLKANGKRLVEPGYHEVYPYSSASENFVPAVEEGEELAMADVELEAKQTQPPRRYGQSRLIKKMEKNGLGTKCLTGDSKVLVRDDRGDLKRRPIQSVFEAGQVVLADGDTDVATSERSPRTLSLDEGSGRMTEREGTLVSQRPLDDDEQIYEIHTERGSFSVTDDHPLYVWDDGIGIVPASEIETNTELVTTGRPTAMSDGDGGEVVLTWEEFAAGCDKGSKLYGVDCNDALAERRDEADESQYAFAERLGSHRPAITRYENDDKDVPLWLLGALDIRPDRLHGLNYETTIANPFPLEWSPELARVIGSVLGDGSVHVDDAENVVDVRYHNTDPILVEQFLADIETLFDVRPTVTKQAGRESHHKTKYQVNLSCATGRVLKRVLDAVFDDGVPDVPEAVRPAFIGSLFDDEGHISRERKAFISNVDHDLLEAVQEMLSEWGVNASLDTDQHKLHVRGRRNLERFFDDVPIAADEKFYRGYDALMDYDVTQRKAELLDSIRSTAKTTAELSAELDVSMTTVQAAIRELREDGHIEKTVEGSNRSHDGNRAIRYLAREFEGSIFATLSGHPSTTTVRDITERDYEGNVYDLTIDGSAPNFAIQGGVVVHNSTRHNTIEKLYDRGYIENDPPRPTTLAKAVVEAAEEFADHVVSDEMTAQLETDMSRIANGEATLDDVTKESREMLEQVFEELASSREEVGEHLRESLKADKRLGPCPDCGEDLLVRRSRQGSYFVGCDGFPECKNTLPLPSTGEPLVLEDSCDEHDMNHVKMLAGRDTFVHGCPRCEAEKADETEDEIIGVCPDCGEEHDGELAIKRLRSGSRLVGCTRYPDCDYSLPLPRNGDIVVTEERCEEHDLPEVEIHDEEDDDDPWELGCPICNFEEYQASQRIDDLEDLSGIGGATAEKLADVGVDSPDDLREIEPGEVAANVQGISAQQVEEWQESLAG